MATHKSAWKRYLQSEKRRERNRSLKSATNTEIKRARQAIADKKANPTTGAVKTAVVALAKAASKGLMTKKTASRRISRLMKAAVKAQ